MSNFSGPFVVDVDDVVDAGIRVGLDAELVRPERMDRVERRDVQPDERVRRQHEVRHLDAAVRRVAVRELPLLRDHLDVERLRVPRRAGTPAFGPWPPPDAVLQQLVRAEAGEEEDGHRRDDDPEELDPRVAADRRSVDDRAAPDCGSSRARSARNNEHEDADRSRHRDQHRVVEDLPRSPARCRCRAGSPGRRRSRRAASRSRSARSTRRRTACRARRAAASAPQTTFRKPSM